MADFLCKAVNLSFQSVQWFDNLSMFYTVEDPDVKIKSDPIWYERINKFEKRDYGFIKVHLYDV